MEELFVKLVENWAWLGAGGVVGFVIRQDRRITKAETLCDALVRSVDKLTDRLDKIAVILMEGKS